jgi:hypothetical protein
MADKGDVRRGRSWSGEMRDCLLQKDLPGGLIYSVLILSLLRFVSEGLEPSAPPLGLPLSPTDDTQVESADDNSQLRRWLRQDLLTDWMRDLCEISKSDGRKRRRRRSEGIESK